MKTGIKALLLVLAVGVVALMGYGTLISQPLFKQKLSAQQLSSPTIAPPTQALTFARTEDALLLVSSSQGDSIVAVDLTAVFHSTDPIELYNTLGYDSLEKLLAADATTGSYPLSQLITPVSLLAPNVAAGTNYAEHAEEVYLDDPPFLFPKLSQPTNWNAAVDASDTSLLDYEAELCMVPLQNISTNEQDYELGLILCNDFTDRLTLLKQLDFDLPMGQTGFAAAKGKPTFLPVGYLFVIPRSALFYQSLEIELYVNDGMRQQFSAGTMILKPADIISQTFALSDTDFYDGDRVIPLLPQGIIPSGSIILTGTAAGVIFKPLNIWNPGFYLHQGDRIITRANYLGHLDNTIQ